MTDQPPITKRTHHIPAGPDRDATLREITLMRARGATQAEIDAYYVAQLEAHGIKNLG